MVEIGNQKKLEKEEILADFEPVTETLEENEVE